MKTLKTFSLSEHAMQELKNLKETGVNLSQYVDDLILNNTEAERFKRLPPDEMDKEIAIMKLQAQINKINLEWIQTKR